METGWSVVLMNISAMFLVILVGWVARKRGVLTGEAVRALSRLVVSVALPSMVFASLLRTVDPGRIRHDVILPVIGIVILLIGLAVGWAASALFCSREQRPTFAFMVFLANWIFLPLPIAQQLYGDDGVRAVLLINVGAQLMLWTVGVWTLRRGRMDWASLRNLALNPGMIATTAGIAIAFVFPEARTLGDMQASQLSGLALAAKAMVTAPTLLGGITIPLALVVTGAQLGGLDMADCRPTRSAMGVVLSRLVIAPVAIIAALWGIHYAGVAMGHTYRMVAYIIACMPVAVNCSMFTDVYGGDTRLAAQGVFYSTLLSIATVPAFVFAVQTLHL